MSQRLTPPAQRYVKDSGSNLSYGEMWFYEPLTATEKAVYSNDTLSTVIEQPVALSEYGVLPDVFLDGDYRTFLFSDIGVQQWCKDSVNTYALIPFDEWSESIVYPLGADGIVTFEGDYYVSLLRNNLNKDPSINPEQWMAASFLTDSFDKDNLESLGKTRPELSNIIIGDGADWVNSVMSEGPYIGGMKTSCYPSISAPTGVTIAAGSASTDSGVMVMSSAPMTKLIASEWVAGTGFGGLATGVTLTASTWYYLFAVLIEGESDFIFDSSPVCQNGVANNDVTSFALIGCVRVDNLPAISPYLQYGRKFVLVSPIVKVLDAPTAGGLVTIDSPLGRDTQTRLLLRKQTTSESNTGYVIKLTVRSPYQSDDAVTTANADLIVMDTSTGATSYAAQTIVKTILTNTLSQVRVRADYTVFFTMNMYIITIGFTL